MIRFRISDCGFRMFRRRTRSGFDYADAGAYFEAKLQDRKCEVIRRLVAGTPLYQEGSQGCVSIAERKWEVESRKWEVISRSGSDSEAIRSGQSSRF